MPTTALIAVALLAVVAGCQRTAPAGTVVLRGTALAGPVCPVEQDPPDPACAERPVEGAEVVVLAPPSGDEIARTTTDADGTFSVRLPPGRYRLVAQPAAGLMAAPAPIDVELVAGRAADPVILAYDTGIR